MIYWLNGAYGAGKTTVARQLIQRLGHAWLFDPEALGNGIRDNYPPSLFFDTFEQYPLWVEANYQLLRDLSGRYDGDIVVPMTLLKKASYEGIIERLKADGVPVRYLYLDVDVETLRHRLVDTGREAPDSWCVQHIPVCLAAQREDAFAIHIDTVGKLPEAIAEEILSACV